IHCCCFIVSCSYSSEFLNRIHFAQSIFVLRSVTFAQRLPRRGSKIINRLLTPFLSYSLSYLTIFPGSIGSASMTSWICCLLLSSKQTTGFNESKAEPSENNDPRLPAECVLNNRLLSKFALIEKIDDF